MTPLPFGSPGDTDQTTGTPLSMHILYKVKQLVVRHFIEFKWYNLLLALLFYLLASWVLMWLSGEREIASPDHFFYWIVVTASTVGYGDFSPVTSAGRWVTSLFVIPLGLGLFGILIGRMAAHISFLWRKGVMGLDSLDYDQHILVIGWNEEHTLQLLRLLLRELDYHADKRPLALCVRTEMENPIPDRIGFVRVSSFTGEEAMRRTGVERAARIIIDCQDDDATSSAALFVCNANPDAHVITYFHNQHMGQLLKRHLPNIEPMPSVATEMLAKAAMDPGSSRVQHELLSVDQGMTQYSIEYAGQHSVELKTLFHLFKERYDATLIGVAASHRDPISINPSLAMSVAPGAVLYYIADERINDFNWALDGTRT
ncbi:potassium channel family protein [Halomonas sabkhae]|uniref:potassium channel family protein n=1 Tax=Halomonas sabkhae TaxID=626223 RepID=UPI0025B5EDA0|nr:potassium channel family protein [Halomonas sabkhae]MDN3525259.1 potassium channel family protein [Halomonas sabkhae]